MSGAKIFAVDFQRKANPEDGSHTVWYRYQPNKDIEIVWCSDEGRDWSAYDSANDRATREYASRLELTKALDNNSADWIEEAQIEFKAYIRIEGRDDVGKQEVSLTAEDLDQAAVRIANRISNLFNCDEDEIQISSLTSNPPDPKRKPCSLGAGKPIEWGDNPLVLT